jgi:glyoxalase family protein
MPHAILGLHHVTATVDAAQQDLDFCIDRLGMRLVKKTVNFDNHHVYHFYYGDERGTPGTLWTTFPYKGHGVRTGVKGAGQVVTTSFSAPPDALGWWHDRLRAGGATVASQSSRLGDESLSFTDPSGLQFEIVGGDGDRRTPWVAGDMQPETALRGLHGVTTVVRDSGPSVRLLTDVLGFSIVGTAGPRVRLAAGAAAPGHFIDIVESADAPAAMNGLGTVHHVAMAIATAEEQLAVRDDLLRRGFRVTEVRDRCYFTSIYFREPGGVLYEVATVQPGFTIDEGVDALGRDLKLPPWEEPYREEIMRGLDKVVYR